MYQSSLSNRLIIESFFSDDFFFVCEKKEKQMVIEAFTLVAILKIIIKAFKIEITIIIIKDQKRKSQHEKALSADF